MQHEEDWKKRLKGSPADVEDDVNYVDDVGDDGYVEGADR